MAAPTFKFDALFEYGDRGWAESWWTNKVSYDALKGVAFQYAQMRFEQTAAGVSVVGARLVNVAAPRTGYVITYPEFSAKTNGSPEHNVSEAWLFKCRNADNGARRNFYFRGMGEGIVKTPVTAANFQPSGKMVTAGKQLIKFADTYGLVVRTCQTVAAAGAAAVPIDSISNGPNDYLQLAGTLIGDLGEVPKKAVIVSGFTGLAGKLNGTYGPDQVKKETSGALTIKVGVTPLQLEAYKGLGAYARNAVYDQSKIDVGEFEFLSDKNTGRAFFVPRGRRSGRR